MHSKILWAIVGGFLIGVFVRSFMALPWPFAAFAYLLGVAALLFIFIERDKRETLIIITVICVAFGGGLMRMDVAGQTGDIHLTPLVDKKVTIEGTVSEEPDVRETGVRLSIRATALIAGSSTTPVGAGVVALAPLHTDVSYGDSIRATGTLRLPESFDTGAGRVFNYPQYLAKDGILYELSFAQVMRTGENHGNPIKTAAINVKRVYLTGLGAVLQEPEAGLAGGITVGDKRSIGSELSAQFRRVSLIHMVVLSGYNITIVMNFVRSLLQIVPRPFQNFGIGAAVLFFVLMAGGAASAVRAGAMALIAVFARATGRVFIATRVLGVVAFVMVVWNPFTLAFDPSFQLSALATLGLISFTPLFAARMQWVPEKYGLREIICSTLATQLAVLPLLLYENGNLSLVALPANLLALIPVPFAMFASFIAALGGMIFGSYAVLLAFPAYILLAYIIGVAQLFAAFPFASVSVPAFSAWWMFLAYALLFGGLWLIQKRKTAVA